MSVIYALRAVGSAEVRYIGRTSKPLAWRLHKHRLNAANNYPPLISGWINEGAEIEIVALAECEQDQACAVERQMVEAFNALGHRLTNSHLMPRKANA